MANVFRTQERSNLQPRMSCLQSASAGILCLRDLLSFFHRNLLETSTFDRRQKLTRLVELVPSAPQNPMAIDDEREELIYRLLGEFKQGIGVALSDAHARLHC